MKQKCYQCGAEFVKRIAPPAIHKLRVGGVPYDVMVNDMPEWHCASCNLSVTDEEADEPLQRALFNHVKGLKNG
jgi:hypothetical protein